MAQTPEKMEATPEPQDALQNHNALSNKDKPRPKSRGSTTSLQSVDTPGAFPPAQQQQQQQQQQRSQQPPDDSTMPLDQQSFYLQHGHHPAAGMYGGNPEDMLLTYQQNMAAHMQHQAMSQAGGMPPQQEMRPMSQHGFQEMQHFPMQYPHGMPQFSVHPSHMQHMRHHSEQFEGSPAPEDSQTENGGAKRRKGTASSVANDQELRRLLAQYQGKTLKEVAAEVQKNEGSGGKSEKAKQVFAMLWYVLYG